MTGITTIVHFSMPAESMDEFFRVWRPTQDIMADQPGAISNIMHRTVDPDSPFQFVNVALWESPEALQNALRASMEGRKAASVDMRAEFARLHVAMSQNNYVPVLEHSNSDG